MLSVEVLKVLCGIVGDIQLDFVKYPRMIDPNYPKMFICKHGEDEGVLCWTMDPEGLCCKDKNVSIGKLTFSSVCYRSLWLPAHPASEARRDSLIDELQGFVNDENREELGNYIDRAVNATYKRTYGMLWANICKLCDRMGVRRLYLTNQGRWVIFELNDEARQGIPSNELTDRSKTAYFGKLELGIAREETIFLKHVYYYS